MKKMKYEKPVVMQMQVEIQQVIATSIPKTGSGTVFVGEIQRTPGKRPELPWLGDMAD